LFTSLVSRPRVPIFAPSSHPRSRSCALVPATPVLVLSSSRRSAFWFLRFTPLRFSRLSPSALITAHLSPVCLRPRVTASASSALSLLSRLYPPWSRPGPRVLVFVLVLPFSSLRSILAPLPSISSPHPRSRSRPRVLGLVLALAPSSYRSYPLVLTSAHSRSRPLSSRSRLCFRFRSSPCALVLRRALRLDLRSVCVLIFAFVLTPPSQASV